MRLAGTEWRSAEKAFRPRASLIRLLGDHLIGDRRGAVIELLRNAWDADASIAEVTVRGAGSADASLSVEDDGSGMTFETVRGVWLDIGSPHREEQRRDGVRTPRFGRLPMGGKGVGRFAAHRLGDEVELVTRAEGSAEVAVRLDWEELLEGGPYLDELAVTIEERDPPLVFAGGTGTRLAIGRLRENWTKRDALALRGAMAAMTSPFGGDGAFRARLTLDPDPGWFGELPAAAAAAAFTAEALVDPARWTVSYSCRFVDGGGETKRDGVPLSCGDGEPSGSAGEADLGPFAMRVRMSAPGGESLADGGVQVYRDGVRVRGYGESGDDWLGLEALASPAADGHGDGGASVAGAVLLDSALSGGLVESTARDAFTDAPAWRLFRASARAAFRHLAFERNFGIGRPAGGDGDLSDAGPVEESFRRLAAAASARGLDAAEADGAASAWRESRDVLLAGASMEVAMAHAVGEVAEGVKAFNDAIADGAERARLVGEGRRLGDVVDSLGYVARRSDRTGERASDLVDAALRAFARRFARAGVEVANGFRKRNDFEAICRRQLIAGALIGLIGNSLRWPRGGVPAGGRVYAGPAPGPDGEPGIVVSDDGPGFVDPPAALLRAGASRAIGGEGLGLYLANEAMRAHGGRLVFPEPGDPAVPRGYSGAAVILRFGRVGTDDAGSIRSARP